MNWVISGTKGPTDPTRAMLPFVFAASAVQAGDTVTLMLYEEIASNPNVTLWACKPCVEVRGLAAPTLDRRIKLGGMNEFHAAVKAPDAKVVSF